MKIQFLLCCLLAAGAQAAKAQSLYVAPAESDGDRLRRLLAPPVRQPLTLELGGFARGDTNLMPLTGTGRSTAGTRSFTAARAYFLGNRTGAARLSSGRWQFSYARSEADWFEGNTDAANLYLDSLNGGINPQAIAQPEARMNRTAAARWQLGWSSPVRLGSRSGALSLSGSYLQMERLQQGQLTGSAVGSQFHGTLDLLSTRDLPAGESRGHGLSLDAALMVELSPRWRAGIAVENLVSRVWQCSVQNIQADVTTNTIEPDANGFLHGVPLLQGQTQTRSLTTELHRRLDFSLARHDRARDWLLLLRADRDWRAAVGTLSHAGRTRGAWALLWLRPLEWETGFDTGRWILQFGMSGFRPKAARQADISLTWRIPLGRSH